MPSYFRILATDLDGTLTSDDAVDHDAIAAIDKLRSDGVATVLVTGRIETELNRSFPGLAEHFDAIVTENGAVVRIGTNTRFLAPPVESQLDPLLADQGIPYQRGQVLLACDGTHSSEIANLVQHLGLDCQLVHNRTALMVLPAGVSKGHGLVAALGELGLSPHNAVAIGDAENDLSLLRAAEVGVATANSVPSLRDHADVVSDENDGSAVAALARGPLFANGQRCCPSRHWVELGTDDDGNTITVPGSQATVLVTGESGAGKSYLAGLLVERWIEAGYSVLIIDPEGDHGGLRELPDVVHVDAAIRLPSPAELVGAFGRGRASTILDLTALQPPARTRYLHELQPLLEAERVTHGAPHWIVVDEAHLQGAGAPDLMPLLPMGPGLCLVTYRPDVLSAQLRLAVDVTVTVLGPPRDTPHGVMAGRARVVDSDGARLVSIAGRRTEHVRHLHKYADQQLPPPRRFFFHSSAIPPAGNIVEFDRALADLPPETIIYHAIRGDFSHWMLDTLGDKDLAKVIANLERDLAARIAANVEQARGRLRHAVSQRYRSAADGTPPGWSPPGVSAPKP